MLKIAKTSYTDRLLRGEANAARHINIAAHYDPYTLIDKSGKLIRILQLTGVDATTAADAQLNVYKNRRNSLLKSFSSEFALYEWVVRRKTAEFPGGTFSQPFAQQLNDKYRTQIQQRELYHNRLYLAVVTKPPEGLIHKSLNFFAWLNHQVDKAAKQQYLVRRHHELNAITRQLLEALDDYQPTVLGSYTKQGEHFSQPLALMSQLINFDVCAVPLLLGNAAQYLPRYRLFFNRRAGTLEMRATDGRKRFAAMLGIKEYLPLSYAGLLDELSTLRLEYTLTQSYRFYDRQLAKTRLRDQRKDFEQSRDESISQTEDLEVAFDEAASGDVGFGIHHFTLVCYADSQAELNRCVGEVVVKFSDLDAICVREDVASECGFWAQLPGNFAYIARPAEISTKNLAGFMSWHNSATGKIRDNHWGDAVTVLETITGSPYYFNFHYRDIAIFGVYGASGSGKTLLVGFLIAQSLKFGGKRIILDKNRGLEVLVRALEGVYEVVRPGIPTGFNPCQLEDTPENRQFLIVLLQKMLKPHERPISEDESQTIVAAIEGLYRLDRTERQLNNLAPFFGTKRPSSLRARFDRWHGEGEHAWLFDNPHDRLQLNADIIGMDLTAILKNQEACKTPLLMYIMHRFGQVLAGQRGLIFADEGWVLLDDDFFKEVTNDYTRTARKQNIIFGLATQDVLDTSRSAINAPFNAAASCRFFAPNPTADRRIYVEELGLSESEYELIRTLPDNQHYFLLNYGRGKESVVVRLNLGRLADEIAVISGRDETIRLLDRLRAEQGDDPKVWLPLFHAEINKGVQV